MPAQASRAELPMCCCIDGGFTCPVRTASALRTFIPHAERIGDLRTAFAHLPAMVKVTLREFELPLALSARIVAV
jgi:hypothetical protein